MFVSTIDGSSSHKSKFNKKGTFAVLEFVRKHKCKLLYAGSSTKYGDGGVDLSPIADLTKTEVYELAKELNIPQEIQDAAPTDGLWDDGRIDEDQLYATYVELEWAMDYNNNTRLLSREKEVLEIYKKHRMVNLHKMLPIPVCKVRRTK